MADFGLRPASAAEFATAVDWAANEGWNPGLALGRIYGVTTFELG